MQIYWMVKTEKVYKMTKHNKNSDTFLNSNFNTSERSTGEVKWRDMNAYGLSSKQFQ